jgi:hypothetical protein
LVSVIKILLSKEWKQEHSPTVHGLPGRIGGVSRRERLVLFVVRVQCLPDLLEIVATSICIRPLSRFAPKHRDDDRAGHKNGQNK